MKKIYLAIAFALVALCQQTWGGELWVSPNGNDDNTGTYDKPFATLNMALRQAREWRRLKNTAMTNGGIHIRMLQGVYAMTEPLLVRPEDSGTDDSRTIIEAADGAEVVISGGVKTTGWRRATDETVLPRTARGHVWIADANSIGGQRLLLRQLFVDGKRAQRAKQGARDTLFRMLNFDKRNRAIWIPTPSINMADINNHGSAVEMLVHQRWAVAMLRIKEMINYGDSTMVTFYEPESRLEFEHPWPQPVIGGERGNSSFCLVNSLQLLDEPDEWYQDYQKGIIYYWPKNDADPNQENVVSPYLERLMTIDGRNTRSVKNITFKNIGFAYTAWMRPSQKGHVTLQAGFPIIDAYKLAVPGLPEKAELENQAWIERSEAAIRINGAANIDFDGCSFSNMGSTAVDIQSGSRNINITRCSFRDIGGTAIMAGDFAENGYETHVPLAVENADDICRNITVGNCHIQGASVEDWGCPAISFGYVTDVNIIHNEVSDVNYSGICVGWGWTARESVMHNNRICGNYVHDFARQLYDAGGIYTLSNQPGSEIKDNRIDAIGAAPYATNYRGFYIYLDEATDGYTISNNWTPDTKLYGDNKPGPAVKWINNGPTVPESIKRNAGVKSEGVH
jgi:hypothetical protein